jgi:hypothetical protein
LRLNDADGFADRGGGRAVARGRHVRQHVDDGGDAFGVAGIKCCRMELGVARPKGLLTWSFA